LAGNSTSAVRLDLGIPDKTPIFANGVKPPLAPFFLFHVEQGTVVLIDFLERNWLTIAAVIVACIAIFAIVFLM